MFLLLSGRGIWRSQNGLFFSQRLDISSEKQVLCVHVWVILLSNLNLDHVRLHDVEPLCFSASYTYSHSSSAGLFLHEVILCV